MLDEVEREKCLRREKRMGCNEPSKTSIDSVLLKAVKMVHLTSGRLGCVHMIGPLMGLTELSAEMDLQYKHLAPMYTDLHPSIRQLRSHLNAVPCGAVQKSSP